MKNLIYLASLLIMVPTGLFAQKIFPKGLILDDTEYSKLPFTSKNIYSGQKFLESRVDLTPYCPEVGHQGEIASCVGWAAGYAAMTIEKAILNGWRDKHTITDYAHSALFIYNQISRGDCSTGITMKTAFDLLLEKGNCLARDFDGDVNDCSKPVSYELLKKAEEYRIDNYTPLFELNARAEEKIMNIKQVLSQKKPVIVGMELQTNFENLKKGDESWIPTSGEGGFLGTHAMVVVGYDDNRFQYAMQNVADDMRGAFKVMNSWGKEWGEDGFIWIRYAHFARFCRHAYMLMPANGRHIKLQAGMQERADEERPLISRADSRQNPSTAGNPVLSGFFGFFHYLKDYEIFQEAKVRYAGGQYRLEGDWKTGDWFQLQVKNGFDNGYIYVLSVDPVGKSQVHFPKSEEYNIKFQGRNESALMMSSGSKLIIPAEDSALALSSPGKDHLVALFSTHRIPPDDIRLLGEELSRHKDRLMERLLELLDPFLVPASGIRYSPTEMGFEVYEKGQGKIVPIVLAVTVNP